VKQYLSLCSLTSLELADRFALLNAAFGTEDYRVDKDLRILSSKTMNAGQTV